MIAFSVNSQQILTQAARLSACVLTEGFQIRLDGLGQLFSVPLPVGAAQCCCQNVLR